MPEASPTGFADFNLPAPRSAPSRCQPRSRSCCTRRDKRTESCSFPMVVRSTCGTSFSHQLAGPLASVYCCALPCLVVWYLEFDFETQRLCFLLVQDEKKTGLNRRAFDWLLDTELIINQYFSLHWNRVISCGYSF